MTHWPPATSILGADVRAARGAEEFSDRACGLKSRTEVAPGVIRPPHVRASDTRVLTLGSGADWRSHLLAVGQVGERVGECRSVCQRSMQLQQGGAMRALIQQGSHMRAECGQPVDTLTRRRA